MDSQSSDLDSVKKFRYRFVILAIYCFQNFINFMQTLEFSIIANIIKKHYNVEEFLVDSTTLVFFVSYILCFLPIGFLIEKFPLKWSLVIASFLTLAGNVLKLLGTSPDSFWVILVAQTLVAIAQVYLLSIPTKVATTWFGPTEVSTATGVAVLGFNAGVALGCVQSPYFVKLDDNSDVMAFNLRVMFIYQAIAAGVSFLITLFFFKSRPSLPPSPSQQALLENDVIDSAFFKNMKLIIKDKNFWFIAWSLGLATGMQNAFGILINSIYLNYFPNAESDVGLAALLAVVAGGCIGSVVAGVILDKTHLFKFIGCALLVCSLVMYALVIYTLEMKSRIGSFIAIPIYGLFNTPAIILGFEYLIEVTYPISEACSSAIFNASSYIMAIIITLVFEQLIATFGYLATQLVAVGIFVFSSVLILFVKSDLKRLEANRHHQKNEDTQRNSEIKISGSSSSTVGVDNLSTKVDISRL